MNRRKFLLGSVLAVGATPLLAKLPPAPLYGWVPIDVYARANSNRAWMEQFDKAWTCHYVKRPA